MTETLNQPPEFIENLPEADFPLPEMTNEMPNLARTKAEGKEVLKLIADTIEIPVPNDGKFDNVEDLHKSYAKAA